MGLRVFATADLHIGMKFTRYGDDIRPSLVEARTQALSRMIDTANRAECDLFVLAGDLFDRPNCAKKTVLQVVNILEGFEGKLVALLPGNHDYLQDGPEGLWALLSEEAGDRVLILGKEEPFDLKEFELDAVLYPAPCGEKHSHSNTVGWIKETDKPANGEVRIGIAHGSIEGISPDFDERYYPMGREELSEGGVALWIVGHTHRQWSDGTLFIPGTPEPDGFDCPGEGAAWIIDVDTTGVLQAEPVAVGTYRFLDLSVDITPGHDPVSSVTRLIPQDRTRLLLRLRLQGMTAEEDREALYGYLDDLGKEVFHLRLEDENLAREISRDEIDRTFPEGSFPHLLLSGLADEEDPVLLNLAWSLVREESR